MTDIRIRRLGKRYRLPVRSQEMTSRLDQMLRDVIDNDLLEAALERGGIRRTDEICIRRASAKARLNDGDSNGRMATAWSVSIADAIVEALRDGGANIVTYRSLHYALSEMAVCALRQDFSRSWAWKQLGIWRGDDVVKPEIAAGEVISALIRNPVAAPAVLREIGRTGDLRSLLVNVSPALWKRLTHEVLSVRGAATVHEDFQVETVDVPANEIDVDNVIAHSSIIRVLKGLVDDPAMAISIAKLALVEADTGTLFRSSAAVARAEKLIAAKLLRSSKEAESAAVAPVEAASVNRSTTPPSRDDSATSRSAPIRDDPARSDWGGLLYLLNLLRDHDFKSLMLELPGRSLAWALYQLGLLLVPIAYGDAALLAFAGVGPTRVPPVDDQAPSAEEKTVLEKLRSSLVLKLRSKLNADERELDVELIARIASRRAEIIADPAWIEVHFKLSEVTTDVRRAGLDLDPGWLPWLGAVVRFVYG
jgi:hypothetical protein